MTEPVRLLIWDLDETFWRGVLTEGGIEIVESNKALVIELARRGIVSSICSKNDRGEVEARLVAEGLWDYFVAPSVDWTPKGPRIQALVETLGLRPATVMFVDDNPLNLEEARRFCQGLQVRGAEALSGLIDDPLFAGKDDAGLSRLKQYKLLERRKADASGSGADVAAFLRDSRIEVEIDTDVEANIDRFVELINRTNQLNFTKRRLPEEPEAARAETRDLLTKYQNQAALVRVRDRYGDHGYCGAYVHNSEGRRLDHFAFSCRILGMGVERWLYQKLGRPRIHIKGEVLADLADPAPVDWIAQDSRGAEAGKRPRIGRITARGPCDIGAIAHYFRYHCDDMVDEYHVFRNGALFPLGHSVLYSYAVNGLSEAQRAAAAGLGYIESDFATRLFDPAAFDERGHLVLLSFGSDLVWPEFRHRATGLVIPFTLAAPGWAGRDLTKVSEAELPGDLPAWARQAHALLRAEWDHVGLAQAQDFETRLRLAIAHIPASARICLLAFFTRAYVRDGHTHTAPARWLDFNAAMRAVAASHPHVTVVEVDDLLADSELLDRLHFHRSGLFKIYQRICELAFPA